MFTRFNKLLNQRTIHGLSAAVAYADYKQQRQNNYKDNAFPINNLLTQKRSYCKKLKSWEDIKILKKDVIIETLETETNAATTTDLDSVVDTYNQGICQDQQVLDDFNDNLYKDEQDQIDDCNMQLHGSDNEDVTDYNKSLYGNIDTSKMLQRIVSPDDAEQNQIKRKIYGSDEESQPREEILSTLKHRKVSIILNKRRFITKDIGKSTDIINTPHKLNPLSLLKNKPISDAELESEEGTLSTPLCKRNDLKNNIEEK